jgi:hypothetical protein
VLQAETILVLDDYHLVDSVEVNAITERLAEQMPPRPHLVFSTLKGPSITAQIDLQGIQHPDSLQPTLFHLCTWVAIMRGAAVTVDGRCDPCFMAPPTWSAPPLSWETPENILK